MKDAILVVVAMDVEINVLLKRLEKVVEVKKFGFSFYEGYLDDMFVVVALSGVGVINAASCLTVGIMEYNPNKVINYGVAGAMNRDVHTKDIIVGTGVVNINSYKTTNLDIGEGSNPFNWELLTFMNGEEDKFVLYQADKKLIDVARDTEYVNGNVVFGNIASGDVWNNEIDRVMYFNSKYDTLVEDMESISVYNLCNKLDIPVISFKIVSDNRLLGEEYDRNVGIYLEDFLVTYLKKLKNDN